MKSLLSIASLFAITAAAGACHVKTGLPFATAKIGPGSAPSHSVAERPSSGGFDEAGPCVQELGRDAGGKLRSAHALGDEPINGCLVQGDRNDMYVITVPDDAESYVYRLKVIAQTDTIGARLLTFDDERIAGDNVIQEGKAFRKVVQLNGGESYKLIIHNLHDNENVQYLVKLAPSDVIAEN